ncbi:MAG: hypothetical protein JSV78_04910 [Phycisphaerales bacterium]|nr:MAG: hypothetical protein JSV78_04910 [Phycisphaerales bacterium]
MGELTDSSSTSLSELPHDTLVAYAGELGLDVSEETPRGELLRIIRERQELLVGLDRDALLDVVVWARLPVRRSASKETLASHIARVNKVSFEGLSDRGLRALAGLRGLEIKPRDTRASIEMRLRHLEGFWPKVRRRRRAVMGWLIARVVERSEEPDDYRFLPEQENGLSLKEHIAESGVVGGIAQKLRGVADQYVAEKLDEIERRIDRKLDEIDSRLAEWRDREVSNRLRIVKITLLTAIVVAAISLGYDCVRERMIRHQPDLPSTTAAEESSD